MQPMVLYPEGPHEKKHGPTDLITTQPSGDLDDVAEQRRKNKQQEQEATKECEVKSDQLTWLCKLNPLKWTLIK